MSTTTKKHSSFVNEPMEGKHVTEVPGIGVVLGERLSDKGFKTAEELCKHYSEYENDDEFKKWLTKKIGANSKQAGDCTNALREWCAKFKPRNNCHD